MSARVQPICAFHVCIVVSTRAPETAPFVKVASTRFFGAKVLLHGKGFDDAYQKAMELVREEGRTLVHAFNDPAVVAGQVQCAY